jgi:hypothetical protein
LDGLNKEVFMNDNEKFCCGNMNYYATTPETTLMRYDKEFRSYTIKLEYSMARQNCLYCPWCGIELPKDLSEEWGETLLNEGILTPDELENHPWEPEIQKKIPQEFKTDEWWKKRGL